MKKSYKKLIVFDALTFIILLLDNFIFRKFSNYLYIAILMVLLLILFKVLFGIEKYRGRFLKDILVNFIIVILISFIIYYIFGIFIGFARTPNYLNFYGLKTFIIPYILFIVFREYLRNQHLLKTEKSKALTIISCILFICIDLTNRIGNSSLDDSYGKFIFFALTVLPIVSNNITASYIARKNGFLPNIIWILIIELYSVFLPIVPNDGLYIQSLIKFIFPLVLMYNAYSFYKKREQNIPISYMKKRHYIEIPIFAILIFFLAYFVSGYFRFHAVAVASGSMSKKINVGDVVIVDHNTKYDQIKVGQVIAYKYEGIIVVHRVRNIVVVDDTYYFYTKGDANEDPDDYVVYSKDILGSVNFKMPYIGLPTVWLSRLFNR